MTPEQLISARAEAIIAQWLMNENPTMVLKSAQVGSVEANGKGEDLDLLFHVADFHDAEVLLIQVGFEVCGKESYPSDEFVAYRKGDLNVIITADLTVYDKWVAATDACKYARLLLARDLTKDERVKFHRIIMDGDQP